MKAMCYIGSNSLESRCFHIGTKLKRKLEKKGIIVDSFSSKESRKTHNVIEEFEKSRTVDEYLDEMNK